MALRLYNAAASLLGAIDALREIRIMMSMESNTLKHASYTC
ncbi:MULTISPECIES: hypothetical protein [Roseobacteraceae]|nr:MULTISPECIES: hypothetical protein [Roseobacteraceae]